MSIRPTTFAKHDLDQNRTHNEVKEITDITDQQNGQQSQWATPVSSARGSAA